MFRNIYGLTIVVLALAGCRPTAYTPGADGIGDPYYPKLGNGGYDTLQYTLELSVDPKNNTLSSLCKLEARATQPLSAFNLDFVGLTIDKITVNGREAEYQRHERELTITPSSPIRQGEDFTVTVAYHGSPEANTSLGAWFPKGWFHNQRGEIFATNEINGASSWYPVNDHPLDKAAYRLQITAPKPYLAAAIGLLVQELDQGDSTTYIWESAEPTASYLVGLNIAEYVLESGQGPDGVLIRNYLPPDFPDAYRKSLDQLDEMLAFFSQRFGPYPFKAYGVVIVNSPDSNFAAMETQALSQHALTLTALSENLLAHELAHQWFGDSVTLEAWKDLWLKEGMAVYASWLWKEHREGAGALEKYVRGVYPTQAWASEPPGNPSPDNLYTMTVYDRGALTFHALRLRLGDEAFFQVMRAYTGKYRYSNASTDDFIAVAEEVSGQALGAFFQSWLYDKQIPPIPEMGLKP